MKKKKKMSKFKERVFEKTVEDFYKDSEEKKKRKWHKKVYGVETFESESEEIQEKKPLD